MTSLVSLLFAEVTTRPVFEWGRVQTNSDLILPVAVAVTMMLLTRLIYRRDAVELRPIVGWLLTALRTLVILGLLVLYLQPQWRNEQERRINSRAVVLVDNSLSMGMSDSTTGRDTRTAQVADAFAKTSFIDDLTKKHDVSLFRFGETLEPIDTRPRASDHQEKTPESDAPVKPIDWPTVLAPVAPETRLGEALAQAIDQQREAPVSGIILISDGRQNAAASSEAAVSAAAEANIPIFTVGIGSNEKTANVRISDFVAPTRAYPGDQYTVTGFLQATRMAGRRATVELYRKEADTTGDGELVESRDVILSADGEVLPLRFELSPDEAGRQTLTLVVKPPVSDRNPVDNRREADVEIVDRKSRVLLLAGGPMREYRFLRNLLFRDESVQVDVLLQSAVGEISQEANQVLDDFPTTRDEMYKYDCVVAMDPDWQKLDDTQIALLESWVGEQGGGLIVAAGPVNMGNAISGWIQDERLTKIRSLYPVKFQRRFATSATSYASAEPWPLDFTREGREAEYLWLADDQTTSEEAWAGFDGVYSFYPVDGAKPGATVLAYFSDPRTGIGDRRPVYLAVQFYGSGRVLYLGSAELWRLRSVDEAYYETIYTKLLRHVSQGRLMRGSPRGTLLVDRDRYMLGGVVEIRAQLTDARLEPLADATVPVQLFAPDGTVQTINLAADPSRAGSYAGHFTVLDEGAWRVELPIPDSEDERLTRRIQVRMPELERENPRRNDPLLSQIAKKTGGRYYTDVKKAFAPDGLVTQLKDRTRTVVISSAPSRQWQLQWLRWLMYVACGLLFAEWLIRRLLKLA